MNNYNKFLNIKYKYFFKKFIKLISLLAILLLFYKYFWIIPSIFRLIYKTNIINLLFEKFDY